jgi:hypothetical protein
MVHLDARGKAVEAGIRRASQGAFLERFVFVRVHNKTGDSTIPGLPGDVKRPTPAARKES